MVERTRQCNRCGATKPWSAFYAGKKWEDGTMRYPKSHCKVCSGRYRDERDARHPERKRARRRASWERRRHLNRRMVPVGPFAAWLRDVVATHPGGASGFAGLVGVSDRGLRRILKGEQELVRLSTVDRVLLSEGATELDTLYPLAA